MAIDKQRLLDSIDLKGEVTALLGQPQGGKRFHCYRKESHANDDKNASLTIGPNGYYKCHTCSVRGDFFQLYMDVNGVEKDRFGETLLFFARKYGIQVDTDIQLSNTKSPAKKKRAVIGKRKAKQSIFIPIKDIQTKRGAFVADWLGKNYGISMKTILDWGLGWSTQSTRLFIPIPINKMWIDKTTTTPDELVNIRKHDIMRYHCTWQKGDESISKRPAEVRNPAETGGWKAVWNKGGGKVVGIRGHNSVYVYPMSNLDKDGDIWIVGGELKALLLTQLGFNAVTFTCGEGSYASDLLNLFTNKTVKVVYDIDKAGVDGANNVGQALANNGAIVQVGSIPADGLPDNGDISDYLRINDWNIESLSRLEWRKIERQEKKERVTEEPVKEINYKTVSFAGLTEGSRLGQYVSVPVLVSGRGDTPYAVPLDINATCNAGKASAIPKCKQCSLPSSGFQKKMKLSAESVVDLTGMPKSRLNKEVKQISGIPANCNKPKLKIKYATVEKLVTVPTVDINDDIGDSMYRHHRIYYISGGEPIRENVAYKANGKIVGDPRDNKFTLAATSTEPLDGDVFSYKFSHESHEELRRALWSDCNNNSDVIWRTVRDLRDHVLYKYGQDTMIMVEWMSWFMPFQFNIGQYLCHKVCPEVMVLGPTRVGKSTMAQDLTVHFGAGRYADCGANTTFVGLIGGNADIGSSRVFTWGLIPTSHGGVVILDEYNKLSYEVMGGLTNQKSSGIAERITNSGVRKTRAFVRYLTLCNPRGRKKLEGYESPLDAAIDVVGTPQDLARIDFLFVAQTVSDPTVLNRFHSPEVDHRYKRELARYHLKWAWSLNKKTIRFRDPKYVLDTAHKLSQILGRFPLIQPAESKFKLGRAAISIASMCYSFDKETGGVIVENEHIDLANSLFLSVYGKFVRGASVKSGVIPPDIVKLFDRVSDWRRLRVLSTSDKWGAEDLNFVFGSKDAAEFKFLAQLEYCLVRRQGSCFIPIADEFQELISEYINNRRAPEGTDATKTA